jgi:hypothetical protein
MTIISTSYDKKDFQNSGHHLPRKNRFGAEHRKMVFFPGQENPDSVKK